MIRDVASGGASGGRILVVEDVNALRALIQEVLAEEGYEAVGAADGAAALERATQAPPDLVLLDLHLPGLPADEFVRRYRAGAPGEGPVRIILVSGAAPAAAGEATEALGALDWLAKPFALEQLLALVARHLPPAPGTP